MISLGIFTRENGPQFIHICMQSPNQSYGDYKGHIETYVNYNTNIIVFAESLATRLQCIDITKC